MKLTRVRTTCFLPPNLTTNTKHNMSRKPNWKRQGLSGPVTEQMRAEQRKQNSVNNLRNKLPAELRFSMKDQLSERQEIELLRSMI